MMITSLERRVSQAGLQSAEVPLFASLPQSELDYLASTLRVVDVAPGAVLFNEGDCGEHFYVISSGWMEVVKALGTSDERLLGVWGPGEFISEMSLMSLDALRTASVRAATAARLLELTRHDFELLLGRQPRLAYEMVQLLSARLADSHDAAIRDLQDKNRQLLRAFEQLEAAQAQIVEKGKIEHELQVAHNIQMGILPRRLPELAGLDLGALVVPMRAVGGDFYDFIPLSDTRLGIAIGDVSGHGVPAALLMALTVTLLRAEACRDCTPSDVLRAVNRQLLQLTSEGMFVTVLYGVLDSTTREFTYVRAGHEPFMVCSADGEVHEPLLQRSQALGVWEAPSLPEQTIQLAAGCTLLLYTDGVTEAAGAQDEMYGAERLKALIGPLHGDPPQVICERLLEQVTAYTGGTAPGDDIALVCVRVR